ncbi:aspartate--tRNA(Asn) ligase, partial [Candidatus Kaiserbacteria bacterium]|nr:aspartate--tRNA(Asn) ligase [Candidatus Kaiserbacteria bacterium]
IAKELRSEWVVSVIGIVHKRPEKMVKEGIKNGDIELEITAIEVLAKAEIPFDLNEETNLITELDNRPYVLRNKKNRSIFKVQSEILNGFRDSLTARGFREFQAPKIVGGDAEGGGNVYEVDYFGTTAGLATSPQLYKQMMVGVYERVFTTGNVFRAEKHATSRHINEYTSLDYEFGFIKDHTTVMDMHESIMRDVVAHVTATCAEEFTQFSVAAPTVPVGAFPRMKLREAQELLKKEYGIDAIGEPDLEPEHERLLCQYASEKLNSDFIFVTHYPTSKRPFYTYEDENDPGFTNSFDLLFRGVEITTGGQRRHTRELLIAGLTMKGLDPEKFSFYLQAFTVGMPPHGGIGMGLERVTQKFLGLSNVKEATLFPREINRIDTLLSKDTDQSAD